MDILFLILGFFVLYGALFGIPLPYIKIGKKIKKSSKWTMGLIGYLREKLFVNDNVIEHFTWLIEEFDNFVSISYTPSFTSMYSKLSSKAKLSKMEKTHISREIESLERRFQAVKNAEGVNRKKVFKEAVKDFKKLVVDTSKMARDVIELVEKRTEGSKLPEEILNRYKFTASEFNLYIRRFRNFLDRTHCYHNIEIEHHRLRNLLLPEELPFRYSRKVEKL